MGGLLYILKQPAHPEVFNQMPVLSDIGQFLHSYSAFTHLPKAWPIIKLCAIRLLGIIPMIAMVIPIARYHSGQIIVQHMLI